MKPRLDEYPVFKQYFPAERLALAGNHTAAGELLKEMRLLEDNFLQLSLLLDCDVITYTHKESVTVSSVMGSLGGILNLWVGMTFVTVMEIVDFCVCFLIDRMVLPTKQNVNSRKKDDNMRY